MDTNDKLYISLQSATAALSKGGGPIRNIEAEVEGDWDTSLRVPSDFPSRPTFPQIISEIVRQANIAVECDEEHWPVQIATHALDSIRQYGGCQYRGEFHVWDEVNGIIQGLEGKT